MKRQSCSTQSFNSFPSSRQNLAIEHKKHNVYTTRILLSVHLLVCHTGYRLQQALMREDGNMGTWDRTHCGEYIQTEALTQKGEQPKSQQNLHLFQPEQEQSYF